MFFMLASLAGVDELTQSLVGRSPDWSDWTMNVMGICFGAVICCWVLRQWQSAAERPWPDSWEQSTEGLLQVGEP